MTRVSKSANDFVVIAYQQRRIHSILMLRHVGYGLSDGSVCCPLCGNPMAHIRIIYIP